MYHFFLIRSLVRFTKTLLHFKSTRKERCIIFIHSLYESISNIITTPSLKIRGSIPELRINMQDNNLSGYIYILHDQLMECKENSLIGSLPILHDHIMQREAGILRPGLATRGHTSWKSEDPLLVVII